MTSDPSRKAFQNLSSKKGLRDVDSAARVRKMKALGFSLYGGLPIGAAAGFMTGHTLLGLLLGPVLIWIVTMSVAGIAGRGVAFLYVPSGSSTPRKPEHSRAEALAIRGEYEAAVAAYEGAVLDTPRDGEPYLRIARIYRDKLGKLDDALIWFRRSVSEAQISQSQEILIRREIAELLIHHLQEPGRAAPDLARLAEAHPDTAGGRWAREELARIKGEMSR